jgi:2'-5' RNA ligase
MPRCFLGIEFPEEVTERLLTIRPQEMRGTRLIGRDELHLTVHFLGDVSDERLSAAVGALNSVAISRFGIAICGTGMFLSDGAPRVLWAGVEAGSALLELHRATGDVLRDAIGFEVEQRAYHPHVTLARCSERVSRSEVDCWLDGTAEFAVKHIPVEACVLFSSQWDVDRPVYRAISRVSLG